jgi:hypothetical protein
VRRWGGNGSGRTQGLIRPYSFKNSPRIFFPLKVLISSSSSTVADFLEVIFGYIVNIMKSFDNFDYLRSWLMGFTKSESKAFSTSSSSSSVVNLLQKKSGFSKIK